MGAWQPDPSDLEMFRHPERIAPIVATGSDSRWIWQFRAAIREGNYFHFFEHKDLLKGGGGAGGGGGGALPFDLVSGKKLGHFGSIGWGGPGEESQDLSLWHLHGVVSRQTARVRVELENGKQKYAQMFDTGNAKGKFFVAVFTHSWSRVVALADDGSELDVKTR